MSGQSTPGLHGIATILTATGLTFGYMAATAGSIVPLAIGGAAIMVGLWAVQSINKR